MPLTAAELLDAVPCELVPDILPRELAEKLLQVGYASHVHQAQYMNYIEGLEGRMLPKAVLCCTAVEALCVLQQAACIHHTPLS